MTTPHTRSIAAAFALVLAGACVAKPADGDDDQRADLEQYNQLASHLEAQRSDFLGTAVQELAPVGNQVFWYDTTSFDFTLASYNDSTGDRLAYQFSIGGGDQDNYRASASYVVTADPTADPVVYTAYDATSANTAIDSTTLPKPPGAQWDAYAVDGSTVYLVDTSVAGQTALMRWTPGQDPTLVTTLEAAGVAVGELEDFAVSNGTMVFIESGRIWKLELATKQATWLMNQTEVSGAVDFRSDGIMFESASGVMFYDYAQANLVNVTERIDANAFQINPTFASAAKYYQGFSRWKTFVIYIGNNGLFAYDLVHDTITPILLSPQSSDLRVDYRYPVALDDGRAFVTGLTSTDGATGADGPTYKLDLTTLLD